ncbi:MAG: hypothetical protein HYS19_00750 [Nitrosomonadales bacterium]|nr:hypothetical protein [Nitrosomonadales bacterium]
MKAQVTNRKIRTLAIFAIACLLAVVASKTFKWFVATNNLDVPTFVWYIYFVLVMAPPFWAGFKFMDAWKRQEKPRLPDDKHI